MSLLDTVPERLALMAYDADDRIRYKDHLWRESLDGTLQPAVLIDDNGGDFPPISAGLEEPTERYTINLVVTKFGSEIDGAAAQKILRSMTVQVIRYILKRPQLQFSNLRNITGMTALPGLAGVKYARLTRGVAGKLGSGSDGEGAVWGCQIAVTVTEIVDSLEVVIKSPPTLT